MEKRRFLQHRSGHSVHLNRNFSEISGFLVENFLEKREVFAASGAPTAGPVAPASTQASPTIDTTSLKANLLKQKIQDFTYPTDFVEFNDPYSSGGAHKEQSQALKELVKNCKDEFSQNGESIQELALRQTFYENLITNNGQITQKENINTKQFGVDKTKAEITNPNLLLYLRATNNKNYTPEQAYLKFMQMNNVPSSHSEENNPDHIAERLAKFTNWTEQQMYLNGVPKPANRQVHFLLLKALLQGSLNLQILRNFLSQETQSETPEQFYSFVSHGGSGYKISYLEKIKTKLGEDFVGFLETDHQISKVRANTQAQEKIHQESEESLLKEYGVSFRKVVTQWTMGGENPALDDWLDADENPTQILKESAIFRLYNKEEKHNFWKSLHGYTTREMSIRNQLDMGNQLAGAQAMAKDIRENPSKVMDVIENFGDEIMDGNPVYIGALIATFFLARKNPKLRNFVMTLAGAGFANKVIDDATGVNLLDEAIGLIKDTSELERKNISSYTIKEMEKEKMLNTSEFSKKELGRAATFMGQENFQCVSEWYNGCKLKQIKANNQLQGSNESEIYLPELPDKMKENMESIFSGLREDIPEEQKAKVYFEFFEQFLKHTDKKRNRAHTPSAGNGFKYLSETYNDGIPETQTEKNRPYRMDEIFNLEISQQTLEDTAMKNIPIVQKIRGLGSGAMEWFKGNYRAMFGELTAAEAGTRFLTWIEGLYAIGTVVKFVEHKGQRVLQVYNTTGPNGGVWGVIKATAKDVWTVKIAGKQPFSGTFEVVSDWVVAQAKSLKEIAEGVITSTNALLLNIDKKSFPNKVNMNNHTETLDTLQKWGVIPEIAKMYGFVRPQDFETFLNKNWSNVLLEIHNFSNKSATSITKKDILQFFVGPAYIASIPATAITKGLQWMHEKISGTVQTVVPLDSVENAFESFTIRTDGDVQKYIGGRDKMRNLIDISRTQDLDTEISWTIEDIEKMKDSYRQMKRGLLIKHWGSKHTADIDGILNQFLYSEERGDTVYQSLQEISYRAVNAVYKEIDQTRKAVIALETEYTKKQKEIIQDKRTLATNISSGAITKPSARYTTEENKINTKIQRLTTIILPTINGLKTRLTTLKSKLSTLRGKTIGGVGATKIPSKREYLNLLDAKFVLFASDTKIIPDRWFGDGLTGWQKDKLLDGFNKKDKNFNTFLK